MNRAFQVHARDNVATLLDDATEGLIEVLLSGERTVLPLLNPLKFGHKVALTDIQPGEAVVKYGVRIGHATQRIARGAWIHLHNLASDLDERSGTLDLHSGAPTDTQYE